MENVRLTIAKPGEHASLSDFNKACSTFQSSLRHVARCVTDGSTIPFVIDSLEFGSATIMVSPTTRRRRKEIVATYNSTVRAIESGESVDGRLDIDAIGAFIGFSKLIVSGVPISISGVRLTERFSANLNDLLFSIPPSYGSVRGRLEAISVHNSNRFVLYPPSSKESVQCRFKDEHLKKLASAFHRKVTVFGKLSYARHKKFPVSAEVDSFCVEPDDDQLSDLIDLRGAIPGIARSQGFWDD